MYKIFLVALLVGMSCFFTKIVFATSGINEGSIIQFQSKNGLEVEILQSGNFSQPYKIDVEGMDLEDILQDGNLVSELWGVALILREFNLFNNNVDFWYERHTKKFEEYKSLSNANFTLGTSANILGVADFTSLIDGGVIATMANAVTTLSADLAIQKSFNSYEEALKLAEDEVDKLSKTIQDAVGENGTPLTPDFLHKLEKTMSFYDAMAYSYNEMIRVFIAKEKDGLESMDTNFILNQIPIVGTVYTSFAAGQELGSVLYYVTLHIDKVNSYYLDKEYNSLRYDFYINSDLSIPYNTANGLIYSINKEEDGDEDGIDNTLYISGVQISYLDGEVKISGYILQGDGKNPSGFVSLDIANVSYKEKFIDYGHTIGSKFSFTVARPQLDTDETLHFETDAGLTTSYDITIQGFSDVVGGWTPIGERIEPSQYNVETHVGQEIFFKVSARDADPYDTHKLDRVEWIVDSNFELLESDNIDYFSSSAADNNKGNESISIKILTNNTFESQVIARVFTSNSQNYFDVKWNVKNTISYAPVVTGTTFVNQSNIPLGEHDFEVTIFDEDDNTKKLHWILDGKIIENDRVNGANPLTSESVKNIEFFERGIHTLVAQAIDEDGNVGEFTWDFIAGFESDGFVETEIEFRFAVAPEKWRTDFSTYTFRSKQGYYVNCKAVNSDPVISFVGIYKNDQLIKLDTDSDGDDYESASSQLFFETSGTHEVKCLSTNIAGGEVAVTYDVQVVEADGKSGSSPEITDFFPKSNTIYLGPSSRFYFALKFHDYESDPYLLEIKSNGQLIGRSYSNVLPSGFIGLQPNEPNVDAQFKLSDIGHTSGSRQYQFTVIDARVTEVIP